MSRGATRRAGQALVHPGYLVAMALLLLNDHWFKQMAPGVLTGKLSDFAGLYVTPIACVSILELLRKREVRVEERQAGLLRWGLASGLCFGLMQVWQPAGDAYRLIWGAMMSMPEVVGQLFQGQGVRWNVVHHTPDVSDLLALPMALMPLSVHSASLET